MPITISTAPNSIVPSGTTNLVRLSADNWDDFSYKTLFSLIFYDKKGKPHNIGSVKIGFFNQPKGRTSDILPPMLPALGETFFSLGQDVEYYKNIRAMLDQESGNELLLALRDVIYLPELLAIAEKEDVFQTSLMRNVSSTVIHHQFIRVLSGHAALSEFHFAYRYPGSNKTAKIDLTFKVEPSSKPSTNIHVLIGRNGVGKTTLLNNMVDSILDSDSEEDTVGRFYTAGLYSNSRISADYFSGVVSVSFSAFDTRVPPPERRDPTLGLAYSYIGLKKVTSTDGVRRDSPKTVEDLCEDFIRSLKACLTLQAKKERWVTAIRKLESDTNFADMNLSELANLGPEASTGLATKLFRLMSSGHRVVLLSITKLVETVEEKTLVVIDEPESHLHPPLLSAFTRAISDLLINRNGVAIVATHSPVVVQEVPKSCVWILSRSRSEGRSDRPENETFGENVGVLTREIFKLEVTKSGFHEVLEQAVKEGKSFETIKDEYGNQLGFEAQAILRALILNRTPTPGA